MSVTVEFLCVCWDDGCCCCESCDGVRSKFALLSDCPDNNDASELTAVGVVVDNGLCGVTLGDLPCLSGAGLGDLVNMSRAFFLLTLCLPLLSSNSFLVSSAVALLSLSDPDVSPPNFHIPSVDADF